MSKIASPAVSFEGVEVAAFESRNAKEIATLISRYGGAARVAPSMREVPLEENAAVFAFAEKLMASQIDAVVFMTGVGATVLLEILERRYPRQQIVQALARTTVIVRGPKAARAAREMGIPVAISAPEPSTWREILTEVDKHPRGFTLKGSRIAVQEYGASNEQFFEALSEREAEPIRVPVYRWALPEDIGPLQEVLRSIADGQVRIVLFTNAVQVDHVMKVAAQTGLQDRLWAAFERCLVCSVGPTCSEALASHDISVDLEPDRHKMGILVREAAKLAAGLLRRKSLERTRVTVTGAPAPREERQSLPLWYESRFMKACRREPTDATPVWLMRQAGRYLKEYRSLRARTPFLDLCKSPDAVAEITVSATERIGADAAILFADLLLIAEPMGFRLDYEQGEGPVISPALRSVGEIDRLREIEPRESLAYVFEAVRRTRASLDSGKPLIGFAGAPFTLASYLIEGGTSKSFRHTKTLMYRDPAAWHALMEYLTRGLMKYINGQVAAGVQAVQVFDSWVGCLSPGDYQEYVAPHVRRLFQEFTSEIPMIHFGTGTGSLLERMRDAGGSVIGLDARVELDEAWQRLGSDIAVQGNMDPVVLYAEPRFIRERARKILQQAAGRPGHIFSLGHGILPETPVEHVIELVRAVHEESGA
ncbi:MAG: uroporphyrinogen decarboxylase, partial [Terriglobia bacterium]